MAGGCAVGVDEVVGAVMDALRAAGYRETTLIRYRTLLRRLAAFCWRHGGEYTCELGALFATQTTSPVSGMFSIERWFDHGR